MSVKLGVRAGGKYVLRLMIVESTPSRSICGPFVPFRLHGHVSLEEGCLSPPPPRPLPPLPSRPPPTSVMRLAVISVSIVTLKKIACQTWQAVTPKTAMALIPTTNLIQITRLGNWIRPYRAGHREQDRRTVSSSCQQQRQQRCGCLPPPSLTYTALGKSTLGTDPTYTFLRDTHQHGI